MFSNRKIPRHGLSLLFQMFVDEKTGEQPQETITLPPAQLTPDDEDRQRPPNAFIIFDRAMRSEVSWTDVAPEDIGRQIGRLWQAADEQTREVYRQQARELREVWQQLHPGETPDTRKRRNPVQPTKTAEPIRIRVILDGGDEPPTAVDHPLLVSRLDDRPAGF